jgi:hypothetical protein
MDKNDMYAQGQRQKWRAGQFVPESSDRRMLLSSDEEYSAELFRAICRDL